MSSKGLVSLGSFRTVNETPEERYKRLEAKYGKDLHDAMARKDTLKKEGKVNNWMEVFVLLNDQKVSKPLSPLYKFNTPNGQVDPIIAAGIVKNPLEQAMLRKAAQPSAEARRKTGKKMMTISKEDRAMCKQWLEEAVESEKAKLDNLLSSTSHNSSQAKEHEERINDLKRQLEELSHFEEASKGQELTIDFSAESIFNKRVKQETIAASLVAFLAFLVMFFIMYFLK